MDPAAKRPLAELREWITDWSGKLTLLYGIFVLAHFIYIVFRFGGDDHLALISNIVTIVIYFGPFVLALRVSKHPELPSRTRRAWLLIALAYLTYTAASVLWLYFENVLETQPFPSLADVGYLAYYPLMLAGLLCLGDKLQTKEELLKFTLDVCIVLIGGGMILWYFLLGPIAEANAGDDLVWVLSLAYPIGDLVLLLGIASLLLRNRETSTAVPVNLLLLGMVINFFTDFAFSYQSLQGTYQTGNFVDAMYSLACFPVIAGAYIQHRNTMRGDSRQGDHSRRVSARVTWLPYAAIAVGYGTILKFVFDQPESVLRHVIAAAAVLTGFVVVRQVLAMRENVRANTALADLQERFQGIYAASKDAIGFARFDGTLVDVNDALIALTGFEKDELLAGTYQDLTPDEYQLADEAIVADIIKTGRPAEYEKKLLRKDGAEVAVAVTVFAVKGKHGDPIGLAAIIRDITERKFTQDKLKEAEERWHLALGSSRDGIWDWNFRDNTVFYSSRWREMFGYDEGEDIGIEPKDSAQFFHPDDQHIALRMSDDLNTGRATFFDVEFRHRCKNGEFKWVRSRGQGIKSERSGRLSRVIGLHTDITEDKRQEAERHAVSEIVEGSIATSSLDELFNVAHKGIGRIMPASNCYIALHDPTANLIHYDFWVDEYDPMPAAASPGKSFGSYVLRTGQPLLLNEGLEKQMYASGVVDRTGTDSPSWMGVPLRIGERTIGVLVVQDYEQHKAYSLRDLELLGSIADQLALAIERKRTEFELRASETQLREAQEIASLGSWKWDLIADKIKWSEELYKILGLENGEYTPTWESFLSHVHPEDRDQVQNTVESALANQLSFTSENRIIRPDGTVRVVHAIGKVIVDESGSSAEMVGTAQDVTDRKRADEEMSRLNREIESQRQRLDNIIANIQGVVWEASTNSDSGLDFVSDYVETMLGYTVEEWHSDPKFWLKIVHPDDREKAEREAWEIFKHGTTGTLEFRWIRKDGRPIWVESRNVVIRDDDGQATGIRGVVVDITERKKLEQDLRAREEGYRAFIEHSSEGIWRFDFQEPVMTKLSVDEQLAHAANHGFLAECNDAMARMHGYDSAEELRGKRLSDLFVLSDDENYEYFSSFIKNSYRVNDAESHELSGDGKDKYFLNNLVGILEDGKLLNAWGTQRDITERKQAEEQLRIFNDKLQRSNRELQDFAYVASHDLQEPLRKVQTFADRLSSKYASKLDDSGLDYLERMRSAAQRMQTLIQDLLSFSRVATKTQPFVPVDLEGLTREVLSDLEVSIEQSGAMVELHNLPTIDADPSQMRQLIQNLVGNAIKFCRPDVAPQIRVTGECKECSNGISGSNGNGQRNLCRIVVEDNGIGFDEKYLDKIFTVFQRLHGRTEYEGSGIGLAVCRRIVERHHGTISAESAPGSGSRFIVTLPLSNNPSEVDQ